MNKTEYIKFHLTSQVKHAKRFTCDQATNIRDEINRSRMFGNNAIAIVFRDITTKTMWHVKVAQRDDRDETMGYVI